MRFFNTPGIFPAILFGSFLIAYLVYLCTIWYRASKLRTSSKGVIYKVVLRSITFILLIIAYLGPLVDSKESSKSVPVQKNIYFALDLTSSMSKTDIQPNRLRRSLHVAKQVVENTENCRYGLITFSSIPYVYSPLTADKESFLNLLSSINENLLVNDKPDLYKPFLVASQKFERLEPDDHNILVVLTPSVSYPDTSSLNKTGSFSIFPVIASLSPAGTEVQGLNFYKMSNESEAKLLLAKINSAGTISEGWGAGTRENLFYYFLIPAFLLLVLDTLITVNVLKI